VRGESVSKLPIFQQQEPLHRQEVGGHVTGSEEVIKECRVHQMVLSEEREGEGVVKEVREGQ
jgi:hypothetical protein